MNKKELVEKLTSLGITLTGKETTKELRNIESELPKGGGEQSLNPLLESNVKEDVILPSFEGAEVVAILDYGAIEGFKHCKMSDGTTKHVPSNLFK